MLMEKIDYSKIYELFSRYSSYPKFDVNVETRDISFAGSAMQCQMSGPATITMTAVFHSSRGFEQFARDIIRLEEIGEEEYLRRRNPALQHAWEEYQLILKLTR